MVFVGCLCGQSSLKVAGWSIHVSVFVGVSLELYQWPIMSESERSGSQLSSVWHWSIYPTLRGVSVQSNQWQGDIRVSSGYLLVWVYIIPLFKFKWLVYPGVLHHSCPFPFWFSGSCIGLLKWIHLLYVLKSVRPTPTYWHPWWDTAVNDVEEAIVLYMLVTVEVVVQQQHKVWVIQQLKEVELACHR